MERRRIAGFPPRLARDVEDVHVRGGTIRFRTREREHQIGLAAYDG